MEKLSKLLLNLPPTRSQLELTKLHRTDVSTAEKLALELSRMREATAMVAHDMRNLLAPLVYGAEILGRTDDPEITLKVRRDILVAVAHLRRMVDDLLTKSGCEQGHIGLVKTIVDLRDVVTTSLQLVKPLMEPLGHEPEISIAVDGPIMASGDFCRLTQVISNLLINAAKFTPGGGDIQVALMRDAQDAMVVVRDSGIGIGHEEQALIFEVFSRGADAGDHPDKFDGFGLGLPIARQLVELHGGSLTVFSAGKDMGSEFVVRLPTVDAS
jgi:two-component system CheB/CheR fusion protein